MTGYEFRDFLFRAENHQNCNQNRFAEKSQNSPCYDFPNFSPKMSY